MISHFLPSESSQTKGTTSETVTSESAEWKTLKTIRCQRVVWDCFCISLKKQTGHQLHKSYILMRKQCLMFMLLLAASTAVTQGVISWWENNASMFMLLLTASTAVTQGYFLMRKQCVMFMLLLTHLRQLHKELYLDEKTMHHVYILVSRWVRHLSALRKSHWK